MKKFKSIFILIAGFIFVISLSTQQANAGGTKIWVSKDFSGGKQCQTKKSEWPDPEKIFKENSISFSDKKRESRYVCAACGCPAYSFIQQFLINEKNLGKAEKLGFKKKI